MSDDRTAFCILCISGSHDKSVHVEAKPLAPADCSYCKPDHKFYGPGWVYMGNGGPIGSCPVCNPRGEHPRQH